MNVLIRSHERPFQMLPNCARHVDQQHQSRDPFVIISTPSGVSGGCCPRANRSISWECNAWADERTLAPASFEAGSSIFRGWVMKMKWDAAPQCMFSGARRLTRAFTFNRNRLGRRVSDSVLRETTRKVRSTHDGDTIGSRVDPGVAYT